MDRARILERLKNPSGGMALAGLTLGTAATVLFTDRGIWPKCPIYALTGFYCPGCGGLRATEALLHGNWQLAIDQNALLPIIPVLIVLGFLAQKINRGWVTATVIGVTVTLAAVFTWLRNMPGSWLAPA